MGSFDTPRGKPRDPNAPAWTPIAVAFVLVNAEGQHLLLASRDIQASEVLFSPGAFTQDTAQQGGGWFGANLPPRSDLRATIKARTTDLYMAEVMEYSADPDPSVPFAGLYIPGLACSAFHPSPVEDTPPHERSAEPEV